MFKAYANLNPQNICVLRSSSKLFPLVCNELLKVFPEANVSAVVTKGVKVKELPQSLIRIYETRQACGFFWKDFADLKEQVGSAKFDLAVVLYNDLRGQRYLNVDAFAFGVAERVLSVNVKCEIQELSKSELIAKAAKRVINFFWVGINYVLTAIMIVAIFIVMVVTSFVLFLINFFIKKK